MPTQVVKKELELVITREGQHYTVTAKSEHEKTSEFTLSSLHSTVRKIQECLNEQSLDEDSITQCGTHIFDLLFSTGKKLLHQYLDQSDHLTLILNMKDPFLNEIPWELCYDPDYQLFLGADPCCSLVRRDQKSTQSFGTIDYPLKVLLIVSSPMDLDEKGEFQPDPDEIIQFMEPLKELQDKGMVQLDWLERASVKYIQDALKEGYHIVHFVGHGLYDSTTEKGYLIIEDRNRNEKRLEGKKIAQLFGVNPPQLVILTACESSPLIPFLLSRKIPAVLAMQYTVLKDIAHDFVERFYSLLVKGDSIAQAVSTARSAILLERGIENPGWFTPVLYVRSKDVLQVNVASPVVLPEKKVEGFDMVKDLIGVETFVGRRKDLWLLEKILFEEKLKLAVVTGIGGIGKTALASKFVKRHKNRFRAAFAKKMVDPAMKGEEILGVLNQFFIRNGEHQLDEVIAEPDLDLKLEVLIHCLKKGYLLILDNFEVLIKDNKIADKSMEKCVQALLSGDHSSKAIITSRYGFTFQDGKAGGLVNMVDLKELSLQFAGQLLGNFGIKDDVQKEIYMNIGGNPQFLEFFAQLTKSRRVEDLLEDITPVREKIGDWLLNELVGLLTKDEENVLKKFSVFRLPVGRGAFTVLGSNDKEIEQLVYYSLVKFDKYYFMHQGVKEYVDALLLDDERKKAHSEAVLYYKLLYEKEEVNLLDVLELHYHLVASEQYEEAGDLVLGLSEPFVRWGYWAKLMELLMQTVKTTNGRTKAGGLHNLGAVVQSLGNYKEAEKLYRGSLDIAKSLGDKAGIAKSLHNLGALQQYQGNYKEAEKLYRESLDIKKSLGDKAGIASSLHQLGVLQKDQGNYKEAEKYCRESLDLKKSLGDKQGIVRSLHLLAMLQESYGDYKEAEKLYRESLELAESLGDKVEIAALLHQLGMLQQDQGNYKEAEKLYRESLDILKSLGDKAGIASSLHQLGMLQQHQENYKEAEKLYRESLDIKKSLGDKAGIAKSLHNLGVLQQDQKNYKEAEKLYRESLDIKKSLGDKAGIASSLHNLGMLQQYQGNYKEAEKLYRESLDILESLGDKAGIALSFGQIGTLNEERKNYEEAVKYYVTSLSIFIELHSPSAETAIKCLRRMRETMGEKHFDTLWKTITNQEVPDYIKTP